ncbi:hypothetical protein M408DRAFT_67258 [Serendipita vermifera MAFF 305830]|uniref:Hydrophobin n=1 Tax=Serendipita vermifera MAFF 305830 TaxID=933852 RepID=A0A0C2XKX2_SERVB|nr:hypothetical protein M408DRAFT_67258 [Serendipita vermifera MAFF 305830]
MTERKDLPLVKRHDHINSPESATALSCNVGEAQCCQSIHQTQGTQAQFLSSLLGLALPVDNSMLGVQCTPIANLLSVLGGSSTCNSRPVCCTGNDYQGLVSLGCTPITA